MKQRKLRNAAEFEFPPSVIAGGVNLSIYEDCGCTIDNYGEILSYSPQMLRLGTKIGILQIDGERLEIAEMNADTLMLTGRVSGAFYEEEERK